MDPRLQILGVGLPKFTGTSFRSQKAHPCAEWHVLGHRWSRSDAQRGLQREFMWTASINQSIRRGL